MTPRLKVFIIHTSTLTNRMEKLDPIIKFIKESGKKSGYTVEISIIISPDPQVLYPKLEELQNKISYDKSGNELFDQCIQVLSLEMISNIEKHKDALSKISISKSKDSDEDLYLIIEDDMVILQDCLKNFEDLLKLDHKKIDWDLIILGLSKNIDTSNTQKLENIKELSDTGKVLPSKEAYFIRKNVATKLLAEFQKYRFTYRIQLSWFIHNNSDIKVYYPSKRTTVDGSKLGLFTSSIHSNNILTFNNEYMQMYNYLSMSKEDIQKNMQSITDLYKTVKGLNSCDFTHLYGLLKIKADSLREGEEILLEALDQVRKSQGLLNGRSDLANNLVELYRHLQTDINPIKKSRYDIKI